MEVEELHASMQFFFNAKLFTAHASLKTFYVSGGCQGISGFFQMYNTCTHIIPEEHIQKLHSLPDRSFENIFSRKTLTAGSWKSFVCNFHVSLLLGVINVLDLITRLTRHAIPTLHFK